ncbi:MAG: chemotaxis-specific protein-glutamate methyltransferase CheB, partial [Acidobacteria bacterium]|nr:chemotaxis-specific protein-glutamate methyltransferase CheB [Acidobacteriota bacterium]
MSRARRARIAVADDSSFIRRALERVLAGDPTLEVVGLAASGEELLRHLDDWQPDAVVLDLSMPGMGGLLTLDALQARRPVPVLILSTHSRRGAPETIEALHRGATDFIDKQQVSLVDFEALRQVLVEKLHGVLAAGALAPRLGGAAEPRAAREEGAVNVSDGAAGLGAAAQGAAAAPGGIAGPGVGPGAAELVVLGASTGGPPALERILGDLGAQLPVPVAVVQHMPPAFTRSFAKRLDAHLPLPVREAAHHERLLPGVIYIAPGGLHLVVARHREVLRAVLSPTPEPALHRPSVDVLFTSSAAATRGRLVAVLLTGMGLDGAAGMARLARAGVHTIAQDRATSVVFGMPRAA